MNKIGEFIAELESSIQGCPKGALSEATRFRDQPWWDSLAALTTLAVFDSIYGKQLTAVQLRQCETIGQVAALG